MGSPFISQGCLHAREGCSLALRGFLLWQSPAVRAWPGRGVMARREIAEWEGRRGSVNVGSGPWRRKRQWEIHSQAAFFYQDHGAGLFVCFRFNQCAYFFFVAIACVVMVPLTSTVCLSSLLGQRAGCCLEQDVGAWTTVPFPKSQHSSDFSNTPQKGKRNTVT